METQDRTKGINNKTTLATLAALCSCVIYGFSFMASRVAMMQNYAVTYIDLARTKVFENIIPVISVVAGVVLLGEPFSMWQLAGMILILIGVWKVTTSGS